jgi:TRAP-type C4-dicarboxylate transport system permease small subunit
MQILRSLVSWISRGSDLLLRLVLSGLVAGLVYVLGRQVLTRYLFNFSEYWTEELARYFLIWMTFLGGALAVRRRAHISMGLAVMHLKGATAEWVRRLKDLCVAVFAAVMLMAGGSYVQVAMEQRTPVTQIPVGLIYLPIPLAGGLMLLFLLEQALAGPAIPSQAKAE